MSTTPVEPDPAQIIDFRALRNWLTFALRAARRRRRLVLGVAAGMFVLALGIVSIMPKTFRVECRLLAQKNSALALRGDTGGDAATRSASDLVTRRENVINLMKQTNLVEEWKKQRSFLFRLKDKVKGWFTDPPTEQQEIDGLADYLQQQMLVYSDDTSVTFQVDWRDPQMAYRLVDAAQKGFLEIRRVQEVSSLAEAVSILEGRSAAVREEINNAVSRLQELREKKQSDETNKPAPKPAAKPDDAPKSEAPAPRKQAESPEAIEARQRKLAELQVEIDAKERMLGDLEGGRVRRLAALQTKLEELRTTYTESHPSITEAKQAIISASQESPQLVPLREEIKALRAQQDSLRREHGLAGGGGGGRSAGPARVAPGGGLGDVIRIEQESAEERDPEIEYARSQLRFAITSYQTLGAEIGKTLVDLKTAEAAFKYRYTIVTPPKLPRGPISPKKVPIVLAALIGGLLIGMIGAVALEFRQGVLYAPWQVEQGLSLRVLADVKLPPALPPNQQS